MKTEERLLRTILVVEDQCNETAHCNFMYFFRQSEHNIELGAKIISIFIWVK